jgi:hypothetical protein
MRRQAARIGTYGRVLTRGDQVASNMDDEMRFHVEMETERLQREQGLPPQATGLGSLCGRAAWQIAAGVLAGSILSGAAFLAIGLGLASAAPLLLAVAAIMGFVGLLAAFGPARRGLRIQAIEALRADA